MLAGSESKETNELLETILQDLLRKCLDASSRRCRFSEISRLQNYVETERMNKVSHQEHEPKLLL